MFKEILNKSTTEQEKNQDEKSDESSVKKKLKTKKAKSVDSSDSDATPVKKPKKIVIRKPTGKVTPSQMDVHRELNLLTKSIKKSTGKSSVTTESTKKLKLKKDRKVKQKSSNSDDDGSEETNDSESDDSDQQITEHTDKATTQKTGSTEQSEQIKQTRGTSGRPRNVEKTQKKTKLQPIDEAIQAFNFSGKNAKEFISEIETKIAETSQTSDKSVLWELDNAKKQVQLAKDWDKEFTETFGTLNSKSKFDKIGQDYTEEEFRKLLIKTTKLEAKTQLMDDNFKLYEKYRYVIFKKSISYFNTSLRKKNKKEQVNYDSLNELIKVTDEQIKLLKEDDFISIFLLKNEQKKLEEFAFVIETFKKQVSKMTTCIDNDSIDKIKKQYKIQKGLAIKPESAFQLKEAINVHKFAYGKLEIDNNKKYLQYETFKNILEESKLGYGEDIEKKFTAQIKLIDKDIRKMVTKRYEQLFKITEFEELYKNLQEYDLDCKEISHRYKMIFVFKNMVGIWNFINKFKTILTKQKVVLHFTLDEQGLIQTLKQLKLESVSSLIFKNESELQGVVSQYQDFEKIHKIIVQFKQSEQINQAKNQKITLKKLNKIAEAHEEDDENEASTNMTNRIKLAKEFQEKFKDLQFSDRAFREELKSDFQKYYKLSENLQTLRADANLELTQEENKIINKAKRWSNIVYQADQMINHQFKQVEIDTFSLLHTQIEVCKSLLDIDIVSQLKEELDKISEFQSKVSDLFDKEPQDRNAIKTYVDSTKTELKINYDIEFDAIYQQITKSEEWDY